ncbi:MAG: diaminopimelate decarboxylase [Alphaproteobacteria bacterium]|nr:diaminopimelate decarboxylase [Alphaproteobacteria bacterium]
MDYFIYKNGALHAEDVAIADIAATVGTPFYCYSHATLARHAQVFSDSLAALKPLVCFAVKANSNLAVLKTLAECGLGADVVSEGELRRALAAGIPAGKIVFSGVGKTRQEMAFALATGIFQFNVESESELIALNDVAASRGLKAPMALRVNPDVDAKTHAKISTGKKENKFGIAIDDAARLYTLAQSLPHIAVQGVSVHIGSQLTELAPFRAAYARVRALVEHLRACGIAIRTIDLGGGLGVPYASDDAPPPPAEYGALVTEMFGDFGAEFIFEPGRLISANAGILVTQVTYVKHAEQVYVIVDAGMNDLMRPALYDAVHAVVPVRESDGAMTSVSIVGPVCESTDVFLKNAALRLPNEGDLLALRTAGAYGASLSNSYNSRLLVPEVMVRGAVFSVIRPRPTYAQMLAAEIIPDWV